jgi:hypothetical protein
VLVDPDGMQLSVQADVDEAGNLTAAMQLDRANPMSGRWRFILLLNYFTSGNQTSLPFSAQIGFNTAQVTVGAPGLPNDPHIKLSVSGKPLIVPIAITNNGPLTQAYFADARLEGLTTLPLPTFASLPAGSGCAAQLPYACFGVILPTQVHSAQFIAQSTVPITMDAAGDTGYLVGFTGAPDLTARTVGPNTVEASLTEPEVPWGEWLMFPTLVGPFGPGGAPTKPVNTSVIAQLKPFDASVSADSGDLWADVTFGTSTFNPIIASPAGGTATIHVTLTPNAAQVGTTVRGFIYIDTFNPINGTLTMPGPSFLGDEVVRIPYSYTVVP